MEKVGTNVLKRPHLNEKNNFPKFFVFQSFLIYSKFEHAESEKVVHSGSKGPWGPVWAKKDPKF